LADFVVITSDNPRTEDPERIIDMIVDGIHSDNFVRISDRKAAIFEAISMAKPGDTVLIAGKGHEDYQILGDRVIHFDDAEVAEEAIRSLVLRKDVRG
ncbi:UDP-N-acetylmuramoyl-L-alanyl-D-glutamate--2,6-diaminopimelate ligase, partial [bacterium]|nr:UDP-N-acetylmuramoyl-L-alanyl-D-glutamate--2,6-diaminopimelate ligase [bacterium]